MTPTVPFLTSQHSPFTFMGDSPWKGVAKCKWVGFLSFGGSLWLPFLKRKIVSCVLQALTGHTKSWFSQLSLVSPTPGPSRRHGVGRSSLLSDMGSLSHFVVATHLVPKTITMIPEALPPSLLVGSQDS